MNKLQPEDSKKNKFQVQGSFKEIKGSILNPHHAGLRFVLSVNNMAGKLECPIYPLIDKKWGKVKSEARGWYVNKTGAYKLGATMTTAVQSDVWVIHMLCQDESLVTHTDALKECLKKVAATAKYEKASVHVAKVLCDSIPDLQDLLKSELLDNGVSVLCYEE